MSANLLAASLLPLKAKPSPAPAPRTDRNDPPGGNFRDYFDIQRIRDRAEKSVSAEPVSDESKPVDESQAEETTSDNPASENQVAEIVAPVTAPIVQVAHEGEVIANGDFEFPEGTSDEPVICTGRGEPEATTLPNATRVEGPFLPGTTIGHLTDSARYSGATIASRGSSDPTTTVPALNPQGETSHGPTPLQAKVEDSSTTTRHAAAAAAIQSGSQAESSSATSAVVTVAPRETPPQIDSSAAPTAHEQQRASTRASELETPRPVRNEKNARLKADPRLAARGESRVEDLGPKSVKEAAAVRPVRMDASSKIHQISIQTGHGDGAAASIGKFLISGATEAAESTSNTAPTLDLSAGTGTAPVALRSTAAPSQPAPAQSFQTTLNQLLSPPVPANDVIDAAARVLTASGTNGRQQVTLQLDPPELGHLRLEIRMQEQAMTLRVDAETHAVARLIESRMSELRDALATHGIKIERSDVVVRAPSSAETPTQQGDDGSRGQQNSHNSSQESSRGPDQDLSGGQRFGTSRGEEQTGGSGHDGRGPTRAESDSKSPILPFPSDANETSSSTEMWIDLVA